MKYTLSFIISYGGDQDVDTDMPTFASLTGAVSFAAARVISERNVVYGSVMDENWQSGDKPLYRIGRQEAREIARVGADVWIGQKQKAGSAA